jgi:hypothetical protein
MSSRAGHYAVRKKEVHCPRRERKFDFPVFQPIAMSLHRQLIWFSRFTSYIYWYHRFFFASSLLLCQTTEKPQPNCVKPTTIISVLHFASSLRPFLQVARWKNLIEHIHIHTCTKAVHQQMEFNVPDLLMFILCSPQSLRPLQKSYYWLNTVQISGNPHILHYGKTSQ